MTVAQLPSHSVLPIAPDGVPDAELGVEELGSRIVGMAGRLASATCRWLLLVAAFDAQEGYCRFGLATTARWLSHYCGLSRRTAIEHVRVARSLAAHAPLADAMAAGRISFSHARAISRIADRGDPALIDELIMMAEHGSVGQLENTVRGLRTVDDNTTEGVGPTPERVSHRWRQDSRFGLSAALDPENGAFLLSAIETVARRENLTQPQALTRVAEIALACVAAVGDAPAPSLRGDDRAAVLIHLDAAAVPVEGAEPEDEPEDELARLSGLVQALAESGSAGTKKLKQSKKLTQAKKLKQSNKSTATVGERCSAERSKPYARIVGGPGLPDRVVKRLLCSGRIRLATYDPRVPVGEQPSPLDIGASRRVVSDKQFRALLLRDGGCVHPGCGSRIGLEAHHVRHWIYGGRTVLANLVLFCRKHHHAHHDGEFTIVAIGPGRFRFLRADGCELPRHVDPSAGVTNPTPIEDEHGHVASDAATTRWDGTRLDRQWAVAVLAQRLTSVAELRRKEAEARPPTYIDPWARPTASAA
jgi:hypothetical protein